MSQREVLEELSKNKVWLSSNEIHIMIGYLSKESINNSLRRLIKTKDIEYVVNKKEKHSYLYRVK